MIYKLTDHALIWLNDIFRQELCTLEAHKRLEGSAFRNVTSDKV